MLERIKSLYTPARAFLACLLLATVVYAGINIEGAAQLSATPALTAATAGGQSSDLTTVDTDYLLDLSSNPAWQLNALFTDPGATASCYVLLRRKTGASTYADLGVATVWTFTATAGPAKGEDDDFPSLETIGGGQRGVTHIELRTVEDVSAGTVRYRPWASASQPAGR